MSAFASTAVRSRRNRTALAITTALGGLLLVPSGASAQVQLPGSGDVRDVTTSTPGLNPEISSGNGELRVNLRARNTVIDWNGFNIPENQRAAFRNGTLLQNEVAVLNRDVSGNVSQLLGNLVSDRNVAVWVYNPNGILVGARAAFNTGSLVLTTLDVDAADFRNGNQDLRLTGTATSQSAITVLDGARIRVEGGSRGLVMVAPKIDAHGQFEAAGQDVAFVTASDVTLDYNNGSPLSVTLHRGTAVPGRSQYVRGTVSGNDALFALASQATITDALLQVGADVTTAFEGTRGIVLSAGRPPSEVEGVTVQAAGDTGGVANLYVDGALEAHDSESALRARSSGAAAFLGSMIARQDVTIDAGGALEVRGDVSSGDDLRFTGRGVTLGGTTAVTQQAADEFSVRSVDGNIVGQGALTLRSGSTGAASMGFATEGSAGGDILLGGGSTLLVGNDRRGALTIRTRAAGNTLDIGDIRAGSLRGATGTGGTANGLRLTSGVTLGDVDVRDTLSIDAGSIAGGALASDGGVTLVAAGTIDAVSVAARGGGATLQGGGDIGVTEAITSGNGRDIRIVSPGAIVLNAIRSAGSIDIEGGSTTVSGDVFATDRYAVDADTIVLGGQPGARQLANGAIRMTAGRGGITGRSGLTLIANSDGIFSDAFTLAIDAERSAGAGGAIDFASDTSLLGGPGQQSDLRIRSADANGIVNLGRVEARGLLGAAGNGGFTTGLSRTVALRTGALLLRGDVLLTGTTVETGDISSAGGDVRATATGGALTTGTISAAERSVALSASGAATFGSITAANAIDAAAGGVLTSNGDLRAGGDLRLRGASVSLAGGGARGGGTVDITATMGGIVAEGPFNLVSTSTRSSDYVRLQAAAGIDLGTEGSIVAGGDRNLNVRIFTGDETAPFVLGDVTARSLGRLAQLDGDPAQAGLPFVASGDLTFDRLDLVDGFTAESLTGDLTIERIRVTGAEQGIDLRATQGTLAVQSDLSASGAITLASGAELSLGTVESRDRAVTITSAGAVRAGRLAGATGVRVTGTDLSLGNIGGGTATLSSAGNLSVGSVDASALAIASTGMIRADGALVARAGSVALDAGSDIVANGGVVASSGGVRLTSAGGTISATGGIDASGAVALSGTALTLGGTQQAGGRFTASASGGGISGVNNLSIRATANDANAGDITLSAIGGEIAIVGASLTAGADRRGTVRLTTDGGGIAAGNVSAASLVATGAAATGSMIRFGDLTVDDGLTLRAAGDVATGRIAAGAGVVSITSDAGDTATGAITAAGGVSLTGENVRFGDVLGTSFAATATDGDIVGGGVRADGAIGVNATTGAVTLGRVASEDGNVSIAAGEGLFATAVTAGGTATLIGRGAAFDVAIAEGVSSEGTATVRSGRSILAPFIRSRAGDLVVAAPTGAITGFAPNTGIDLAAGPGRLFSLTVGTAARLGDITGGNISISAPSITANRIDGGTQAVSLLASDGDLVVTGPITAGDVTLDATGRTSLGSVVASGALVLGGRAGLSFGDLTAASITATGGNVAGGALRSTGAIRIDGTSVRVGRVDVGTGLSIGATEGDLTTDAVVGGGDVALSSAGRIGVAGIATGGSVALAADGALEFGSIAGTTVTASGGAISGQTVTSSGATTIGGDTLALGSVDAGGALALATTSGDLSVDSVAGEQSVMLTSAGRTILGTVDASGAVTVQAEGDVGFRDMAGGAIEIVGAGVGGGSLTSNGALAVDGTSVSIDAIDGGGAIDIVASAGNLRLGTITGGNAVALTASGFADLGSLSGTGAVAVQAGGNVAFDDITGGTIQIRGAGVGGESLDAAGAVTVEADAAAIGRIEGAGAIRVAAMDGDLRLNAVTGGSAVTLETSGVATLGTTAATGALTITAGDVAFDSLSGGSVAMTAANTVRGDTIRATAALNVRGGDVAIGSVEAGGAVSADATTGGLTLGTVQSGGDTVLTAATLAQVSGAVTSGGAYRVTGANVELGGAGIVQQAMGGVRITATGGDVRGAQGLTLTADSDGRGGDALILDAIGGIELAGTTLDAGSASALALRAGAGRVIRLGNVEAGAIGGFDGTTVVDRFSHSGSFEAGDLMVGRMAIDLSAGDLTIGSLASSGAVSIGAAAGRITTGEITAAALDVRTGSELAMASATVGGAATLDGGSITAQSLTAGALTIRTAGGLSGAGGSRIALRSTAGDLSVEAGSAMLDSVESAGGVGIEGGRIDIAGRLAAARQLLVEAREALTTGDAASGADMALRSTGAITTGGLESSGGLIVDGASIASRSAQAGGMMALTSDGALSLGSGTAASGIAVDAGGLATLGALNGGPSIAIVAADAELSGAVRAANVRFATRDSATTAIRLGDGTAANGFRLSNAEVGLVAADSLRFDAGTGAMEIGTLALAPAAGQSVAMLSLGDIAVTGTVSSSGTGRSILLGGGEDPNASAATLNVAATSDAGGRLLFDGADVELRANRIAVGLGAGFIDTLLPGDPGRAQAAALIGNPNSALYNAQLGGGAYAPNATTTVAARSLTVRFGDYALFQNTAVPGQSSGVNLGVAGTPVTPALRISSFGAPGTATFVLFGTINGIDGAAAALLGNPVIDIAPELLPNSRINGCLAGSGAGCLTTIVIQPTLQVFDWDSQSVFGIQQDVAVPFTPIVGGNNEELLTGLPALAPEQPDQSVPAPQEPNP